MQPVIFRTSFHFWKVPSMRTSPKKTAWNLVAWCWDSITRLNILANWPAASSSFPSMTKAQSQWLPFLHHGDQTDGSSACLDAKYPVGGAEEEKKTATPQHTFYLGGTKHRKTESAVACCFSSLITARQLASVVLSRYHLHVWDFIYARDCPVLLPFVCIQIHWCVFLRHSVSIVLTIYLPTTPPILSLYLMEESTTLNGIDLLTEAEWFQ